MEKQVYEIDGNGYIKEIHVEDTKITKFITVDPPNGLYRAKWTGIDWVEDMTQKEIDELNKPQSTEPSQIEILGQEITMLKLSNIAKDNTINTLGQELTNIKLQLQGGI